MADGADDERQLLSKAREILATGYEAQVDFNEFFDSEEQIQIGSGSYPRSKVLYWVDPRAYAGAKVDWENDSYATKHELARKLIEDNRFEHRFVDLLNAIERVRVVPFVGAGLSHPCGMPLWRESLLQLLDRLSPPNSEEVRQSIAVGDYLLAAQSLAEYDAAQTAHFIGTTYRLHELRLVGPVTMLPHIAKGCVVTTNFDDAIEKTYERANVRFEHYMHGGQEHNFFSRMVRGDRCILKLHGDAENRNTHILTRAQYDMAYGRPFDFTMPLPKALRQIFVSQSLLFLGASLEQDWTMDLFSAAVAEGGYEVPAHYAILPAPTDAPSRRQKEARLIALNIQPLWYPDGQHEAVQQILEFAVDVAKGHVSFAV